MNNINIAFLQKMSSDELIFAMENQTEDKSCLLCDGDHEGSLCQQNWNDEPYYYGE